MTTSYDSSLAKKLNIRSGTTVRIEGKPDDVILEGLTPAPGEGADAVLAFVRTAVEAEERAAPVVEAARADRVAWMAYPKAGQLGTDLNRDILWKQMLDKGVKAVRQVAIDDVWSALRFRGSE